MFLKNAAISFSKICIIQPLEIERMGQAHFCHELVPNSPRSPYIHTKTKFNSPNNSQLSLAYPKTPLLSLPLSEISGDGNKRGTSGEERAKGGGGG